MKTPPTSCPRCNSHQSFPVLSRPTTLPLGDVQERYMRCTMCRWEMLLSYTTRKLEEAMQRKRKLAQRAQAERRMHGTAQLSTQRALERMTHSTSSMSHDLTIRVQEARNGTRVDTDST